MKVIYNFLCLLLLLAGNTAMGQIGTIAGKITNSAGDPLQAVNVSLAGTEKGAATDIDGNFRINDVSPGQYRLIISAVGYKTLKIKIEAVANQLTTVPGIALEAQQEELSEVVVNAKKNRYLENVPSASIRQVTSIAKLPQNVQVISSELLIDQQVTSIMDGVIRNVSGVTMMEHWGNFANLRMRGFRVPAFRNGFNVSDIWGPLAEDMSIVDRIEFVKGPSGFMLSAGEPGGFYNVVTKKPTAQPLAQVTLMAGSFDFFRGSADFGGDLTGDGRLLYRLNGFFQTTDSHRGDEDVQRFALAPALTYNLTERTSINAELNYQQAETYMGSAYVFAPVSVGYGGLDRDFRMTDTNFPVTDIEETTIYVNLHHKFSDNWTGTLQLGYLKYDQEGNSAWVAGVADNGDANRTVSIWDALSKGYYAQAFANGKINTGDVSHTILGGIDYFNKEYWADFSNRVVEQTPFNIFNPTYGIFPVPPFDRSLDVEDRSDDPFEGFESTAFYLQDEIGFRNDRIRLTLAGRYTMLESQGKEEDDNKFTPRVGLSVDITSDLTAYALYDQTFLPQAGISADGSTFDPVDANNIEGGLKKSFFDGKLRATLGAFRITKQNLLVGDPQNPDFSIQLGEVQSQGIEFDMQGEIYPGLSVVINYAHTDVEITEDTNPDLIGTRVAGHARHMTNGWFTYNFANKSPLKGFGVSLGYQYQIDRSTWAWASDNETLLPDYFRLDGGIFWKKNKYRIQLNVNNLLDEYLYSGANFSDFLYWQSEPGINGRLAFTYNFK